MNNKNYLFFTLLALLLLFFQSSYGQENLSFTVNGVSFEMVFVEGGTFMMGCTGEQGEEYYWERPVHEVTVSSFYIGKYEITQKEWVAIMGNNPSHFRSVQFLIPRGNNFPVEHVTWADTQEFITKLNAVTGKKYRLATEAEWEYAARGGSKSKNYKYSGSDNIDDVAWYSGNSDATTHLVGTKQPNELGIYDMTGNVWEWCSDWYGLYPDVAQTNPQGPTKGTYRIVRGGGWNNDTKDCRITLRNFDYQGSHFNGLGFRIALSL